MAGLETVDLEGVPILSVGGPYHGRGSPPGGDHIDEARLSQIAADTQAIIGELRPPLKLGHNKEQRLLRNSGFALEDEHPAAGWIENVRVKEGQILSDWKGVPRKLADLIKARAFRTRSVELGPVTSQATGESYPQVIRAVALLGAKPPAVRTLDDIAALYADGQEFTLYEDEEPEDGAVFITFQEEAPVVEFAVAEATWDGSPSRYTNEQWARACVLDRGESFASAKTRFAVPVREPDGTLSKGGLMTASRAFEGARSPIKASPEAIAASKKKLKSLMESAGMQPGEHLAEEDLVGDTSSADTSVEMSEVTFSAEDVKQLAEALSLEGEIDGERLKNALIEAAKEEPVVNEPPATSLIDEAEMEVLRAKADRGDQAFEDLRLERRERLIVGAIEAGKIDPAKREFWEKVYDENPEICVELVEELPEDQRYAVKGKDDGGSEEAEFDDQFKALALAFGFEAEEGEN